MLKIVNVKSRCLSITVLLIFVCPFAQAISKLSLDDALREAEANSPGYQAMRAALDSAKWKKIEGLSNFLPSVTAQAIRVLDYKYQNFDIVSATGTTTLPAIQPLTAASLNVYFPIFDGLANLRRYRLGVDNESAADSDLKWSQFQLAQQVKLRFYSALAAVKLSEVAKQNVKTLEDHLQKTQVQKRGGVSTQFDVLRIEVQLSDARADEIQNNDNVEISKKYLLEILNLETDDRELVGELPAPVVGMVQGLKVPKPDSRADVQAMLSRDHANLEVSKIAELYWVPKIGLSYQYSFYNNRDNSVFDAQPYRNAWQLGLTLTWNIFDGMVSIAKNREAKADAFKSQKLVKQSLIHIPVEFENWKRKFETASVNYKAKVLNVSRAQESVRLAQEGYRAGTRTNGEVLDAELDLFRSRAGVVSTQLNAEEALINLESVVGRKIESAK